MKHFCQMMTTTGLINGSSENAVKILRKCPENAQGMLKKDSKNAQKSSKNCPENAQKMFTVRKLYKLLKTLQSVSLFDLLLILCEQIWMC